MLHLCLVTLGIIHPPRTPSPLGGARGRASPAPSSQAGPPPAMAGNRHGRWRQQRIKKGLRRGTGRQASQRAPHALAASPREARSVPVCICALCCGMHAAPPPRRTLVKYSAVGCSSTGGVTSTTCGQRADRERTRGSQPQQSAGESGDAPGPREGTEGGLAPRASANQPSTVPGADRPARWCLGAPARARQSRAPRQWHASPPEQAGRTNRSHGIEAYERRVHKATLPRREG